MSAKNGGPAFPTLVPIVHITEQGKDYPVYDEAGMTLRDYFAAKALELGGEFFVVRYLTSAEQDADHLADLVAKATYEIADAMIAWRNKEQK